MPKHKKLFEVIRNAEIDGVNTGVSDHRFSRQGHFFLEDPGEAKAIQQSLGQDGNGDVTVIDVPNHDERGISYFSFPKNWHDRIDWS